MTFVTFFEYPLIHLSSRILNVQFLGFADEVLLLIAICSGIYTLVLSNKVSINNVLIAVAFIYFSVVSLLFGLNENLFQVLVQNVIHIKFFVLFYFFIIRRDKYFKGIERVLRLLVVTSILGIFLSLLFKNGFYDFFGIPVETRNKTLRHGGFFKTNFLGFFYVLYYLQLAMVAYSKKRHLTLLLLSVAFTFLFLILGSRTSILIIPIAFVLIYGNKIIDYMGLKGVVGLSSVIVLLLFFFTDLPAKTYDNLIEGFNLNGSYIRGIMLNLGSRISLDYFPIGTGAATFGTVLSEGSVVYDNYGVGHRFFFKEMFGVFDSNLASVLGEFGFIGLTLFTILIVNVFSTIKRLGLRSSFFKLMVLVFILNFIFRSLLMNTSLALIFVLISVVLIKINENFIHFKHVPK